MRSVRTLNAADARTFVITHSTHPADRLISPEYRRLFRPPVPPGPGIDDDNNNKYRTNYIRAHRKPDLNTRCARPRCIHNEMNNHSDYDLDGYIYTCTYIIMYTFTWSLLSDNDRARVCIVHGVTT
uniref:Uncharacterized protein n=1 Tax=Sipha flava TaxID=143950 RepID=A0A2S2QKP4_9HEMI